MQLMISFLRATASFIVIYQRNAHRLAHVDNRLTAILLLSQSTMHELERELRAIGTSLSPPDYAACVADTANDQTQLSAPGMPLVPRTSGPFAGGLCVAKGTPWLEPHDVLYTRSAGPDDDGTFTDHHPQYGSPITPSIDQIPCAVPPQVRCVVGETRVRHGMRNRLASSRATTYPHAVIARVRALNDTMRRWGREK
ncbi:uncharacterized protein F5Z01DRAFT_668527 [Emericellopsis atlantica]|uniref:Uncharacterized protein n=1 Tax=Emericellopsis atlantica TaxID=2614577 RepID=A0A9P7ZDJ0_9HYPO|nr:uncharacterized protein F5Z01DRAFT_668527 [Emericellopsis atlantica]KAG9249707.1 hypothetical protein F5Z01DRAFT_668527 [Emericellopsis atlantica]